MKRKQRFKYNTQNRNSHYIMLLSQNSTNIESVPCTARALSCIQADKSIKTLLFQKEQWTVDKQTYKKLKNSRVFESEIEIQAIKLIFSKNLSQKIIKDIQKTSFPLLEEIWLVANKIQSIQQLANVFLPHLKEVWLRDNRITNTRSLRKCQWPNIETISLYGNHVNECSSLVELHCQKLTTVWLEYDFEQKTQDQDLRWMPKIETHTLSTICAGTESRMEQKAVDSALRRKYVPNELKIYRKDD